MIDTGDFLPTKSDTIKQECDRTFHSNFWRCLTYLTLLSLGGGLTYSWYFATEKLPTILEKSLSNYFSRPVKLGEITGYFPTGLIIGESILETTPTENDSLIANQIKVNFNPWKLLNKELELNININDSQLYLQQNQDNSWLEININDNLEKLPFGFNLIVNKVQFNNTNAWIKNNQNPNTIITVNLPLIKIDIGEDNHLIDVTGKFSRGGEFNLSGLHKVEENQWLLNIYSQNLDTNTLNNLNLVSLPLKAESGTLDGSVSLLFTGDNLENFEGKVDFQGVDFTIPSLDTPLTESKGQIKFIPQETTLHNINTNLGLINANIKGIITDDGNMDITAIISEATEIKDVLSSLQINNLNFHTEGKVKGNINITGNIDKPRIETEVINVNNLKLGEISISELTGKLTMIDSRLNIEDLNIVSEMGGEIRGFGEINLTKDNSFFSVNWEGKDISGEKLTNFYQLDLPIKIGEISGEYHLSGNWQKPEEVKLTGFSFVDLGEKGKGEINNLIINSQNWRGDVLISGVNLTDLPMIDCEKFLCQDATLNGKFNLSGKIKNPSQEDINLEGDFEVDFLGETLTFSDTEIRGDNWQTSLKVNDFDIQQLSFLNISPSIADKGKVSLDVRLDGNFQNVNSFQGEGKGKINLPQGKIDLAKITLEKDNFLTEVVTDGFSLDKFSLGDGDSNNWRGNAKGNLTLKGDFASLTPENIYIKGNLFFDEGISLIHAPLMTSFIWDGKQINLIEGETEGIKATGLINYNNENKSFTDIDLDVVATKIELKQLPLPQSLDFLKYQGEVNLKGNLRGDISQPQLTGNINLTNFELANFSFPTLTGNINFSSLEGLNLQLESGKENYLFSLQLNPEYQPQQVVIKNNTAKLEAKKQPEAITVNLQNIPLSKVTQPYLTYFPDDIKEIGGEVSGEMKLDINSYDIVTSNITIDKPSLNHWQGEILRTEIFSKEGIFHLTNGSIKHKQNRYEFQGELIPFTDNPQLKGELKVVEGDIQNILTAWEFFDVGDIFRGLQERDYASAKDLYLSSGVDYGDKNNSPLAKIESNSDSLWETLEFFNSIEKQTQRKKQEETINAIPLLEKLEGKFDALVTVNFSVTGGMTTDFDFQGNNWRWGKYQADLLGVRGNYRNGLLTLLPVMIQTNDSILSLTGTFQPERISGEISINNLPVSDLKNVVSLPDFLDLQGIINSNIAISGSQQNPLAKGNITVTDSGINGNQIQETTASFGLRNSRIDFLATSNLIKDTESLRLIGSFPFQLFPDSQLPDNDSFKLDLSLNKYGFSLLDILSNNQLTWQSGEGKINLQVNGKYFQSYNQITDIQTNGIATINSGVITGNLLADEVITDINGDILFNFTELNIPNLTGNFGETNISVAGSLPIINNNQSSQFLNLNVDDLALNIDNLYLGNAQANLSVSGSAIAPMIGGKIKLYDGKITPEVNQNEKNALVVKNSVLDGIKLDNLSLILGTNIEITQAPLLNLRAEGKINIAGKLNNLKPEGLVKLKGGSLNLFTSQFSLANNYENIAKFTPENGFNPYLDLRLEGSVTETKRYQFVDLSQPNEIKDLSNSSVNTAQTIRIKADVRGWANNLENSITLSSSPQRNQTEIVALLGGGFLNNLGEGNGNIDLVNLAGLAFFGGVQGEIQKAVGFDELRLFPTQILNPENRNTSLGLGAELALDLTNSLSFSVMKILTNQQPPLYGIRYRLNDQTILRGSTDFDQDSRGVLEFEHRF